MKSILVLPVPLETEAVWRQFRGYLERFCATWRAFPPEEDIDIAAVCTRNLPDSSVMSLFAGLPVRFMVYKGNGADLGAHQWFAKTCAGNPFLICATSRLYFHRRGWGKRLVSARLDYGPGLYGMSASHEGGKLHVCTRGYCLDAEDFRAYPTAIESRDFGVFFECGDGCLLDWCLGRNLSAYLVYWSGVCQKGDWFKHENIFRRGTQGNMLAWDKHSDAWASASPERRHELEKSCFLETRELPKAKEARPLKIAGLMPLKCDLEKTVLPESVKCVGRVCDEFVMLFDNDRSYLFTELPVTERIYIHGLAPWNDFTNRLILLAAAAKHGCDWAMFLDDDETPGPTLTKERVRALCADAAAGGFVQVIVKVRTAWNETQWRTDGVFGQMTKSFLVLNPFTQKRPNFEYGPEYQLHHFPTLDGPKHYVDDYIVHHGMRTLALREKNVAKYEALDPANKFSGVKYDYLLDERNMVLEPL